MTTSSYPELTHNVTRQLQPFRKSQAATMQGFAAMAGAAMADGSVDAKHKELIALGISVSQRCSACIGFHTKALVKLGATRQEVEEALGVAVYMGGGPALMYAAEALQAWEQFAQATA
jgi:AhpD family alkylhydroperoxidase